MTDDIYNNRRTSDLMALYKVVYNFNCNFTMQLHRSAKNKNKSSPNLRKSVLCNLSVHETVVETVGKIN